MVNFDPQYGMRGYIEPAPSLVFPIQFWSQPFSHLIEQMSQVVFHTNKSCSQGCTPYAVPADYGKWVSWTEVESWCYSVFQSTGLAFAIQAHPVVVLCWGFAQIPIFLGQRRLQWARSSTTFFPRHTWPFRHLTFATKIQLIFCSQWTFSLWKDGQGVFAWQRALCTCTLSRRCWRRVNFLCYHS